MSWSSEPDSSTLNRLIEEEVRTEIYYREAKRLNLHQGDEIIRRRLQQKYEFLVKDILDQNEPQNGEILQFYNENILRYSEPEKVSFLHIYFSSKNKNVKIIATSQLNKISPESNSEDDYSNLGDFFHLSRYQKEKSFSEISESFGIKFSESLNNRSLGWIDYPVASGFGYHLVKIIGYKKQTPVPFEDIRANVANDLKRFQQKVHSATAYDLLLEKYTLNIKNN